MACVCLGAGRACEAHSTRPVPWCGGTCAKAQRQDVTLINVFFTYFGRVFMHNNIKGGRHPCFEDLHKGGGEICERS